MLRLIIVDDERLARQAMSQLLAELPSVQIVGEASNAEAGRTLIEAEKPDGLFLDIRMPGQDGFALLQGLQDPPLTVFVTAHSEHAVRAFEVEAVDYLLKPVRPERLQVAITRLQAALQPAGKEPPSINYHHRDRICLRTPGRTVVAAMPELLALQAEGDFTRVHVRGQQPLLICHTLGSYEKELPTPPFFRLDRSILINLERITSIKHRSRDETFVWIEGLAEPLKLGRAGWARLRKSGALADPE